MPCWVCEPHNDFTPVRIDVIPPEVLSGGTPLPPLSIWQGETEAQYLHRLRVRAKNLGHEAQVSRSPYQLFAHLPENGLSIELWEWVKPPPKTVGNGDT
jgi:hypothetical protein